MVVTKAVSQGCDGHGSGRVLTGNAISAIKNWAMAVSVASHGLIRCRVIGGGRETLVQMA